MKRIPNYFKVKHMTTGLLEFDDKKCTRCGICATVCGGGSIIIPPKDENGKQGLPYLESPFPGITMCVACGDCVAACPNKAIKIVRGFTVNKPYFYARLTQTNEFTYPKKY
ncbi:MAG: 4Fe-4S binding protein [Promethearchaeota archaeon]